MRIEKLKARVAMLQANLSNHKTQAMTRPPLSDQKVRFWQQRKLLADAYSQLGESLEEEHDYAAAVKAYLNSYQINQNTLSIHKLGIREFNSEKSTLAEVAEIDLPEQSEVCFYLGMQYLAGLGMPKSHELGAVCLKKAAKQGHAAAQNHLGDGYINGLGVPKDDTQASHWLRQAKKQGDAGAQFSLGWMYQNGLGVRKNETQAANLYRQAAEQGHATAQFNLGLMYRLGVGGPQDNVQAANWVRLAAEQGAANAQFKLGQMYQKGLGVPQDNILAAKWFQLAAEQRDIGALHELGRMYQNGLGVPQNSAQAERLFRIAMTNCYRKATQQKQAIYQYMLGWFYLYGIGTPQNDIQAVHWLRLAAEQGKTGAQYKLGQMYNDGRGPLQKDSAKGYRQDYKNGITNAVKMLEKYCETFPQDFESHYHYAIVDYAPSLDIKERLQSLIIDEPNAMFEAVFNDDLLSDSEKETLLGNIFDAYHLDNAKKLTDENYGKLCYSLGTRLYETEGLKDSPKTITQAKFYYAQVPEASSVYCDAMSELHDLELLGRIDAIEAELDTRYSEVPSDNEKETLADKVVLFHDSFFQNKKAEHIIMRDYNECTEQVAKRMKMNNPKC